MTPSRLSLLVVPALCLAGCFSPVTEVQCGPDLPCADGSACVGGECKGRTGTGGATGGGSGGDVGGGTGGAVGGGTGGAAGGGTGGSGGGCGCLDARGVCQPGTQTYACGSGGAACQFCPAGDACLGGVCTASSCNPATCPTGCCTASGTCVSASPSTCGRGGQQCVACPSGDVCRQGQCQTPGGMGSPGSACTQNSDCRAPSGQSAICKHTTSSGNATYLGGFCTFDCTTTQCPRGSSCLTMPAFGESDRFCAPDCAPFVLPCRSPGYACYSSGGGAGGGQCWIAPLPGGAVDAGAANQPIGAACAFDAQCGTAPAFCFTQQQPPPVGNTGYVGGACAQPCTASTPNTCPLGSACVTESFGGMFGGPSFSLSNCRQSCAPPGSGQSTCRVGYVCAQNPNVSSLQGSCRPSCLNPSAPLCSQGTTCGTNGVCQ